MSQYLEFDVHKRADRKTVLVVVVSKSQGTKLGEIKWFGRWRQYCFYPSGETIWNEACLNDVRTEIIRLMAERKSKGDHGI